MLVHICCSVDSHYFLQELRKKYPDENLIGYFYNPNIHPKEEYDLRLFDVKRSCDKLGISLIVGDYDMESWLDKVVGFENEEEKGSRCSICFDDRLLKSAMMAVELNEKYLSTTLLTSPMKSQNDLFEYGDSIAAKFGLEFIKIDTRSGGGTQIQSKLARDSNLYRQNYCGCIHALTKQRNRSNKFALELFNNIGNQTLKGSARWNLEIFSRLREFENNNTRFILQKNNVTVYRLLSGLVSKNSSKGASNEVLPSYIFTHSKSVNNLKVKDIVWECLVIDNVVIDIGFSDGAIFTDICSMNKVFGANYSGVMDMIYHPPYYEDELNFRIKILGSDSVKPFIVLDYKVDSNLKIYIDSIFQNADIFDLIKL